MVEEVKSPPEEGQEITWFEPPSDEEQGGAEKETTEETSPPEKGQEKEEAAQPTPKTWWEERGFVNEQMAVESFDQGRKWNTQLSQEKAIAKARADTLLKINKGELEVADVDAHLASIDQQATESSREQATKIERFQKEINEALAFGMDKYPDIVKPENFRLIDMLAAQAPADSTVMGRLLFAVEEARGVLGIDPEKREAVEADQQRMLKTGERGAPGKKTTEKSKGAWDMDDKEFQAGMDKIRQAG